MFLYGGDFMANCETLEVVFCTNPEYLIARSHFTEQGPLGFLSVIQFLMD